MLYFELVQQEQHNFALFIENEDMIPHRNKFKSMRACTNIIYIPMWPK